MGLSTFELFKHIKNTNSTIELTGDSLCSLQNVLKMMLQDFQVAADKAEARWTLSGGTCLGSLRHHGFIPWDDDIDINLIHDDLTKFVDAINSLFPGKYTIQIPGLTDDYDLGFARMRLNGTIVRNRDDIGLPSSSCGAYIDIFLLESVPDNFICRGIHGFISMALGFCYSCRRFEAHADLYNSLVAGNESALKVFKRKEMIGKLFSFYTPEKWVALWNRWNSKYRNSSSKYISIPTGRKHYFGELYSRDAFFPTEPGEFEGLLLPVPNDFKVYMEALYGPDYMTPPPLEDREVHVVYEFDLGKYSNIESEDL